MAKKLNKLMKRISALEKALADFFASKSAPAPRKKKKAAKPVKTPARKPAKKVAKPPKSVAAAKSKAKIQNAAPAAKPVKTATRKKTVRAKPPAVAQGAPSQMPEFVPPLDKV